MPGPMNRGQRGVKPMVDDPGKVIRRLFRYIFKDYGGLFTIVFIMIVIGVLANIQGTLFTRSLIDDYITPFLIDTETPDFTPLRNAILKVACFYMLGIVAGFIQNRLMINISQGIQRNLRNDLFSHMETLPVKYFDTHTHGDIMSIYTNDIDTLREIVGRTLPQLVNSAFTVVSVLISMFILSVPLTVITLIMVGITMFATKTAGGLSGKYFVSQQKNLGAANGYIEEMIGGMKVVKVFTHEEKSIEGFDKLNEELCDSANKANKFSNILGPINAQIGNISYVICAVAGGAMALNGWTGLTLGTLASFLTFNRSFNMPINQISMQISSIVMALAGADRIFKLMDEEPEADEGYVVLVNVKETDNGIEETDEHTGKWMWKHTHRETGEVEYKPWTGDVTFDGVDFGYTDEKMVLHDIKMFANAGQKIAFVGSTGAGKTTITNLINRFYDIQDGKIRYDGININKIRKADLRRSLGMVLQETHLFTGTVADNIRYGKPDATMDEVIEAAKLANADGFIRRLPEGYDTMLKGDGANLSQGQRQLLSIARAAIMNPPVLILDEATSSIDTRTERIVQRGMDSLMKGRTTFVIAHRLSTVKNSDCIMVLEQGRIIERGTHDELIAAKGKYYQLYTGNNIA